ASAQAGASFTAADVATIWQNLLTLRNPSGAPGGNARPFWSLSAGYSTGAGDAQFPAPNGWSIEDTLLRSAGGNAANANRLLEVPTNNLATHPYAKYELLNKIYNHLTT